MYGKMQLILNSLLVRIKDYELWIIHTSAAIQNNNTTDERESPQEAKPNIIEEYDCLSIFIFSFFETMLNSLGVFHSKGENNYETWQFLSVFKTLHK